MLCAQVIAAALTVGDEFGINGDGEEEEGGSNGGRGLGFGFGVNDQA